ncbi:hypothetical protein EVAR_54922_1 [Eumeta japonica]|uniref:Uncharacterized protein n=1 Tax=Eumeta variegata TaxID=151549 RepID=A0A4C1YEV0_EUMVA|nr:hypothetical protein EVAR_54922_1 [Eumeta japonica]
MRLQTCAACGARLAIYKVSGAPSRGAKPLPAAYYARPFFEDIPLSVPDADRAGPAAPASTARPFVSEIKRVVALDNEIVSAIFTRRDRNLYRYLRNSPSGLFSRRVPSPGASQGACACRSLSIRRRSASLHVEKNNIGYTAGGQRGGRLCFESGAAQEECCGETMTCAAQCSIM